MITVACCMQGNPEAPPSRSNVTGHIYSVCCTVPESPVNAFLSRLSVFKSKELHWGGSVPGRH